MPKIKKIAFINPKSQKFLYDDNPLINEMFEQNKERLKPWYAPPLSLLVLASYILQDIEIKLYDEFIDDIDFNEKFDIVAITGMTRQINRAYEIAKIFKSNGAYIVIGGIHSSVLPEEALEYADTIFIGEAEQTWPIFLKDYINGVPQKIYKAKSYFNLEKALTPKYELINFNKFLNNDTYFKFIPLQATRGCPHNCSFCLTTKFYGSKIRKKKIEQIIKEIEYIKSLKINHLFLFVDDNFFFDKKFSKELLKNLLNLNIKYVAQSDLSIADDEELLELAYLSGCIMVFIGFESLNSKSLETINNNKWKMKQMEKYERSIKIIQNHGIVVFGAFVIGFPYDNLNTFEETKNFVIKNKIPGQFTLLTPIPGTKIYDDLKNKNKLIKEKYWDECSFFSLLFKHENFTKFEAEKEIINLHNIVFNEKNTYDRNRYMIKIYKNLPPRWSKNFNYSN